MIRRVTLEKGVDAKTHLKDATDFLGDRYDLTIDVDSERYKAAGVEAVERQHVGLPELTNVRLATVLRMIARQVNGVCLISAGKIVIVPDDEEFVKELLASGHAPLPPGAPDEETQSKVWGLVSKAHRDTVRGLRSGTGTGTFEEYKQGPNDRQAQLKTQAKFTLHFDHKRYYVSLCYDRHESRSGRQIIICDNSAVYSSVFIAQVSNIHSWGEVYDLQQMEQGHPREFPWNPSQVTRQLLDVDRLISAAGDDIRMEERPEGYTIRVRKENFNTSCTALKRFGWNLADSTLEVAGQKLPFRQAKATWRKAGDIWYIAALEDCQGQYRAVLRFDDFKANVAISPKLFRLAALELPVGARIFDRRNNAPQREYRYEVIQDDGSRRFFDMEAELESLAPVP